MPACGRTPKNEPLPRPITADARGNIPASPAGWHIRTVPDGTGGALLVWSGYDPAVGTDLWIQKLDSNGIPQWPGDGIVLSVINRQDDPEVIADGSGGAFVVWTETGSYIYAQHIGPTGTPLWGARGIPVCVVAGPERQCRLHPDGSGGIIVLWVDSRLSYSNYKIYGQRIDAAGVPQWTTNGIPLTPETYYPAWDATADGAGGVILAWSDPTLAHVLEQRVTGAGILAWGASGKRVSMTPGSQWYPKATLTAGGEVLIVWNDGRDAATTGFFVYGAKVDLNGDPLWTAGGIPVSPPGAYDYRLIPDGAGGAFLAWTVGPGDRLTGNLFAQHLDSAGAATWTPGGVTLCSAGDTQSVEDLIPDGSGGIFVVWKDFRSLTDFDLYASRVSAAGTVLWADPGVAVSFAPYEQIDAHGLRLGAGTLLVVWSDRRDTPAPGRVFYQVLTASGVPLPALPVVRPIGPWHSTNTPVVLTPASTNPHTMIPDGSGGCFFVWLADDGTLEVRLQRLDGQGQPLWGANGIATGITSTNYNPSIISDGAGGVVLAWQDYRNSTVDVYGQHFNGAGSAQWTAGGLPLVASASNGEIDPILVADGTNGFFLAWLDNRSGTNQPYVRRFDGTGALAWPGDVFLGGGFYSTTVKMKPDGTGGVLVAWNDSRNGTPDIFAQRVDSAGSVAWTPGGVTVTAATGSQYLASLAPDGTGGLIAGWSDDRATAFQFKPYAQRLDAAGTPLWIADGVSVGGPNASDLLEAVPDGGGGAYLIFHDRSGIGMFNGLRIQKLDAAGITQWVAGGIDVNTSNTDELFSAGIADGSGGLIVAWRDYYLRAQHFDASGAALWGDSAGLLVTGSRSVAYLPQGVSDGAGGIHLVWKDDRRGSYPGFLAQRVPANGSP